MEGISCFTRHYDFLLRRHQAYLLQVVPFGDCKARGYCCQAGQMEKERVFLHHSCRPVLTVSSVTALKHGHFGQGLNVSSLTLNGQ